MIKNTWRDVTTKKAFHLTKQERQVNDLTNAAHFNEKFGNEHIHKEIWLDNDKFRLRGFQPETGMVIGQSLKTGWAYKMYPEDVKKAL